MIARTLRSRKLRGNKVDCGWRTLLRDSKENGVALLMTLLLLTLMSTMGIVMVMTVAPDMLINGYYGSYRGSFYAADSGLNIARQQLANQLGVSPNISTTSCAGWGTGAATGCTSPPMSSSGATSAASAVITSMLATGSGGYGSLTSLNSGTAGPSWPGSFEVVNTSSCPSGLLYASGPTSVATAPVTVNGTAVTLTTTYQYQYNYQLCAFGRAQGSQQVYASENGVLTLNVVAHSAGAQKATVSFAAFGLFYNNYAAGSGPHVPGTYSGPIFINGQWQFESGGSYTFTDPISQTNSQFGYWFNNDNNYYQSSNGSYTYNNGGSKTTISPTFDQGFNLGQTAPSLPTDSYSQKWAVLDGSGQGESPANPGNAQLNAALKDANGNAYPSNGATTGVFLPYTCGSPCSTTGVMTGGGIYVEGNATVQMSPGTDSNGNLTQIYTITQGSTTTTVTTTVNATGSAAYTAVKVGSGTTKYISGVPMNNTISGSPQQGTLLYVDGNINLSGPSNQNSPGIQDYSQTTIVANGNVNVTGNLTYVHEPVNMDSSDSLIPANDYNQVLGVFTATGMINVQAATNGGNLQVDGVLAAIGQNCSSNSCGLTATNNIGTFSNVGGRIQYNIFSGPIQQEGMFFDRRFLSKPGFAPPWFPSTSIAQIDITTAQPPTTNSTFNRMSWKTSPQ